MRILAICMIAFIVTVYSDQHHHTAQFVRYGRLQDAHQQSEDKKAVNPAEKRNEKQIRGHIFSRYGRAIGSEGQTIAELLSEAMKRNTFKQSHIFSRYGRDNDLNDNTDTLAVHHQNMMHFFGK